MSLMPFNVTSFDHVQIHVTPLKSSSSTHKPVVFLHALAMSAAMWKEFAAHLKIDAPMYGIDLRGHGQSEHAKGPFTTEQFAKDVLSVIEHLKIDKVNLVGCSMGGTVAMAFAGHYPNRVQSLSLIDTTACYGADAKGSWEKRGQQGVTQGLTSLLGFQVERWFSTSYAEQNPSVVKFYQDVFVKNEPACYLETCRMLGQADERAHLVNYKGPCSVVVGEEDYATPVAMAEEIKSILPQATLTVLKAVRHYAPIQAPGEVAACISPAMS
jgi:3-oxoadipate enol-lactonase